MKQVGYYYLYRKGNFEMKNKIQRQLASNTINRLTNLSKLLDKYTKIKNVNNRS